MCESVEVAGDAGDDAGVAGDFGVPASGLGVLAKRGDVGELDELTTTDHPLTAKSCLLGARRVGGWRGAHKHPAVKAWPLAMGR